VAEYPGGHTYPDGHTHLDGLTYGSLPFSEQIRFFRDKVKLPTETWTDIWEGMHSRAFVVAGAMQEGLLEDLYGAVDRAIAAGGTIEQFRTDFDGIIEKHGWTYKGGRNWRTRVIYETNLRQSYNAGREAQMNDPALRRRRPYGLYRHGRSETPRPEHLAWDGTVLPLDDPWWETHTPQNGWGCKCRKLSVSDADVKRLGLVVANRAPQVRWREVTVGAQGPTPRTVRVPEGIDPGFAYNPGTAAWGRPLAEQAMDAWRAQGTAAWQTLTPGGPADYGRPARVPTDKARAALGAAAAGEDEMRRLIEKQIGGAERIYRTPGGVGDQRECRDSRPAYGCVPIAVYPLFERAHGRALRAVAHLRAAQGHRAGGAQNEADQGDQNGADGREPACGAGAQGTARVVDGDTGEAGLSGQTEEGHADLRALIGTPRHRGAVRAMAGPWAREPDQPSRKDDTRWQEHLSRSI